MSWNYDSGGRRTQQLDPRGSDRNVAWNYDDMDRVTSTVVGPPTAPHETIGQSYDALGRRLTLDDPSGVTTFVYDQLGRIVTARTPENGTVTYAYDALGQRTQLRYPDATSVDYAYTPDGQMRSVAQSGSVLASYVYDPNGRVAERTEANGTVTRTAYDRVGRVQELQTTVDGAPSSRFSYTMDRLGQRTAVTETLALTTHAADSFSRAVTNGWGRAETGGTYTLSGGSSPDYTVTNGIGKMNFNAGGTSRTATLSSVSALDVSSAKFLTDKSATGSGQYSYLLARRVTATTEYQGRMRFSSTGGVYLQALSNVSGTATQLGSETLVSGVTASSTTRSGFAWMLLVPIRRPFGFVRGKMARPNLQPGLCRSRIVALASRS